MSKIKCHCGQIMTKDSRTFGTTEKYHHYTCICGNHVNLPLENKEEIVEELQSQLTSTELVVEAYKKANIAFQKESKDNNILINALIDHGTSRVVFLLDDPIPSSHECPDNPDKEHVISQMEYDSPNDIWLEVFPPTQDCRRRYRRINSCMFCGQKLPTKKSQKYFHDQYHLKPELVKKAFSELGAENMSDMHNPPKEVIEERNRLRKEKPEVQNPTELAWAKFYLDRLEEISR